MFNTRDYFFSPSERMIFTYNAMYDTYLCVNGRQKGNSIRFFVRVDDKKSSIITINDNFINRTKLMIKIELKKNKFFNS